LEGAGFPQQHPCYVSILDSLAEIEGQLVRAEDGVGVMGPNVVWRLRPDPRVHVPLHTSVRTETAGKWGDKGYWSKRFGVSISKSTSKAFKYKALFELQFQVALPSVLLR